MSNLLQKLKKLMKNGVVVDSDDSGSYPVIFLKYLGKVRSRALNMTPFGVWSRPGDGFLSLLFSSNASESNKFGISNDYKNRPIRNLAKGEVVLGNLKSYFHFKADGQVSLFINNVEIMTFLANGIMQMNALTILNQGLVVNGGITTTDVPKEITIDIDKLILDGAFETINGGTIDSDGDITSQGVVEGSDLTNGSVPYNSHVHGGVDAGGDTSGGPQ